MGLSVPREPTCRLFFALWPPDALRRRIAEAVRPFAETGGGRAVPSANFHITLAFVGEVPRSRVDQVLRAGAETAADAFELSLDHIQCWPDSRLLCLTTEQVPPALRSLVDRLQFNLTQQQLPLRQQRFRPHVTLVRNWAQATRPVAIAPLPWRANNFVLVESRLAVSGSQYTVLARWPLASVDVGQ